jgi:hypothetical protein
VCLLRLADAMTMDDEYRVDAGATHQDAYNAVMYYLEGDLLGPNGDSARSSTTEVMLAYLRGSLGSNAHLLTSLACRAKTELSSTQPTVKEALPGYPPLLISVLPLLDKLMDYHLVTFYTTLVDQMKHTLRLVDSHTLPLRLLRAAAAGVPPPRPPTAAAAKADHWRRGARADLSGLLGAVSASLADLCAYTNEQDGDRDKATPAAAARTAFLERGDMYSHVRLPLPALSPYPLPRIITLPLRAPSLAGHTPSLRALPAAGRRHRRRQEGCVGAAVRQHRRPDRAPGHGVRQARRGV